MSSRIRYTDEDRIVARAGEEEATVLEPEGESEFVRLPESADRRLNRGSGSAPWPGGSVFSSSVTVEHGLGATPEVVTITSNHSDVNARRPNFGVYDIDATSFKVVARMVDDDDKPAEGFKIGFGWIAMT